MIITLVDFKGSVPQVLGAKAKVEASGLVQGTVGGGKVEAKAIKFAQDILNNINNPVCQLVTWNLTTDVGMTCGGVVTFLFELIRDEQNWKIVVFGAGHVAQELVPMLLKLKCHVTCIDPREEWLDRLTQADNLIKIKSIKSEDLVKDFSAEHFFVLMTQGHSTDLPILAEILRQHQEAAYVGVIGSKTKAISLKAHLKQMDFNQEKINSYFCPIGLDFGDNSPVEIAYSVVAQILLERDRKLENEEV